jgi:hypothetical protein
MSYAYNRVVTGKPEGRELGRPNRRWEDIRTDIMQTGWDVTHRIHVAQKRSKWLGIS